MDELKERWRVYAWKTYTQYGPGGNGYFLIICKQPQKTNATCGWQRFCGHQVDVA